MSGSPDSAVGVAGELAGWRSEFAVTERYAYLNHAAVAPLPRRTARRMRAVIDAVSELGERRWMERHEECERVRGLAAGLLGARRPDDVAFVANTTTGLSLVAEGLSWREGDNVVGVGCEFPSNVYPWLGLAGRGVEYRAAAEHDGWLDQGELESLIDSRTRVVAVSWVQYASGFRLDLERLAAACRRHGSLLVVDAIQGLGVLRLDVAAAGIDACAAAVHKWLLGPEGLALLWLSDRLVEQLEPKLRGWASMAHWADWQRLEIDWAAGARRLESGTANVAAIHGLGASLELLAEVGAERVERRAVELAERAAARLEQRGWQPVGRRDGQTLPSAIVAARHPRHDADEVAARLRRRGVVVASRGGRVRVAPHFYNSEEEIDRLAAELPA